MVPVAFDEENSLLHPPIGMTPEECETISVFKGQTQTGLPVVVSCWKLTKDELEEINRTGRVYLTVLGFTMPPVTLDVKSPLKE